MLSIVPRFEITTQKRELIFLVDQSGSMDGEGILQAKNALAVRFNLPFKFFHFNYVLMFVILYL